MNTKWYWSTFIVILAFIGFSQQQFSVPNQEIVVQFANDEVTQIDTQNTIAVVKEQLQAIGVENIQVFEGENGKLKITYFSDFDVASIKKILSKKEFNVSYTSLFNDKGTTKQPLEKNKNPFQLDVFEIQERKGEAGDFNALAIELKPETDRYLKTVVYFSAIQIIDKENNNAENLAYSIQKNIAIAIDNSSYNNPEVRAGPEFI